MSPEKNLAYLGDGVAEDIISMLARAPDLSVIARNSSFTYKGKATDVRQVGKDLGVGYVLEGSVRKEADKLRITAQLVNAKTGEHVWAERFDKAGADPWALQDEVTAKIIWRADGRVRAGEARAVRPSLGQGHGQSGGVRLLSSRPRSIHAVHAGDEQQGPPDLGRGTAEISQIRRYSRSSSDGHIGCAPSMAGATIRLAISSGAENWSGWP